MISDQLKEEARREAMEIANKAAQKFDQAQLDVAREGLRFFDRLGLLSGSSIILSVTFLGYLAGRPNAKISYIYSLYASWGFLLAGLLASLYRNFYHQRYFYHGMLARWARKVINQKGAEIETIKLGWPVVDEISGKPISTEEVIADLQKKQISWTSAKGKAEKHSKVSERVFVACEYLAHAGLVLGLLLLAFFAVANTRP